MAELLPCAGEVWFGVRERKLSVGSTLLLNSVELSYVGLCSIQNGRLIGSMGRKTLITLHKEGFSLPKIIYGLFKVCSSYLNLYKTGKYP